MMHSRSFSIKASSLILPLRVFCAIACREARRYHLEHCRIWGYDQLQVSDKVYEGWNTAGDILYSGVVRIPVVLAPPVDTQRIPDVDYHSGISNPPSLVLLPI